MLKTSCIEKTAYEGSLTCAICKDWIGKLSLWHSRTLKNGVFLTIAILTLSSHVHAEQPTDLASQKAMLNKPLPMASANASAEPTTDVYQGPASNAPNPLMRPTLSKSRAKATAQTAPVENNVSNLASSVGSALNSPTSGAGATTTTTSTANLANFDGWYVSLITNDIAVLRAPDSNVSTDSQAPKAGSAGFGATPTNTSTNKQTAIGRELEVENGSSFSFNDITLAAKIKNGLVTLMQLGTGSSSNTTVFSGRLGSRALSTTLNLEKPDTRYVTNVKPSANTARSAQSGSGGGGTSATSTDTPAQ